MPNMENNESGKDDQRFSGGAMGGNQQLAILENRIFHCRACPRLVQWRETVAIRKVRRFQEDEYWGKPLAGMGDPKARLLIIGLAPAAHGGNRTGRMFTGDDSATWLMQALYQAGFSNQPTSQHRDDGLRLKNAWVTAAVRCAPPDNKPTREEAERCAPYLYRELDLFCPEVVVVLGRFAFDALRGYLKSRGVSTRGWAFAHGGAIETPVPYPMTILLSYHPSRQNTQTGRLSQAKFWEIFHRAQALLDGRGQPAPGPA